MKPRVLITCKQMQAELPRHRARLTQAGYELSSPELTGQQFTAEELAPMMDGVVGMIAGDDEMNASFFDASPDLRVLIRWGIGMDSVDRVAAAAHGVTVRNTPGVFGGEVADSAVAYLLLLARQHHLVDRRVRENEWPKAAGISLAGQTVGVIGLGDIGRSVVRRALGFDMSVLGYDPFLTEAGTPEGVQVVPLERLLAESRFVVLCCPLTDQTHHLLDARTLRLMGPDAYLINVARGPVVDEPALVNALQEGRLAGAGLDVFEVEPLPVDSPLRRLPTVVLGSHNASNTREGVARASGRAVDLLLEGLGA